jgi:hypothetical protein
MVRSGHLCGEMSYQGLMRASFGRPGFYILTALQFVYPFIGTYRRVSAFNLTADLYIIALP